MKSYTGRVIQAEFPLMEEMVAVGQGLPTSFYLRKLVTQIKKR